MNSTKALLCLGISVLLSSCGDGGGGNGPIVVAWDFDSGDCTSNDVVTVRLSYQPEGGDASDPVEFPCEDGSGSIGTLTEGTYGILAEGLNDEGTVVAQNYGNTITFGPEGIFGEVDVTLYPKAANVLVTWEDQGGGNCPPQVQLPYYITLYTPPVGGGADVGDQVTSTQEGCNLGQATLTNVAPGDYVVEVDTRAIQPDRRGVAPVTVEPGVDATVHVVLQ